MLFSLTTRIKQDPGSNAIAPTLQSITSTITQPHSPQPTFPASFLSAFDEPWRIKGCRITRTILYTSDVKNASAPGTQLLTQSINSAVVSASCKGQITPGKLHFLPQSRSPVGGDPTMLLISFSVLFSSSSRYSRSLTHCDIYSSAVSHPITPSFILVV